MPRPIYLDHHSTTPCDPRVVKAMLPTFGDLFGNAASKTHSYGWQAEALVDQAREQVAALVGASPAEIIFTSGATESNNLAIKGIAAVYGRKGRHVVTAATEHRSVLDCFLHLERQGFEVTMLPVERDGRISPARLEKALRPETILVSLMFANNEIGAIHPIAEIGRICKEHGVFFHCDAVQALAHLEVDAPASGIDLLAISAHKMYGPKGVGALYVRRRDPRVRLEPLIEGGGQERGLRSGTLNVPGIVGLGKACELVLREREQDATRIGAFRDRLAQRLLKELDGVSINGGMEHRLPNNLNVAFAGVEGEALLTALKEVAVSSGSACTSSELRPSHVLEALGVTEDLARASLRFGLGRGTTGQEVEIAADATIRAVKRLRASSPLERMRSTPLRKASRGGIASGA